MDGNRGKITLLVPAYNEEKSIGKCIGSIDGQILSEGLKVLVIPNGCTDGTVEVVNKEIARVKNKFISWEVVELTEGNKVKAINEGLKKVKTEFVAAMDSDSWIETDVIAKTITRLEENKKLMILGALHKPDFSRSIKGSVLGQFQKLLYYNVTVSTFRIPIGRFMAFRKEAILETPQTVAEDTWFVLETIRKYGNEAVRVDNDLIVNYQPTLDWVDFLRQETRFIGFTDMLFEKFPELKKVYEETNVKFKMTIEERIRKISELMKNDGIPMERLMQVKDLLLPMLKENAVMMRDRLEKSGGKWEVIESTK